MSTNTINDPYIGINYHRLENNPIEKKFADTWKRFNTDARQKPLVDYILDAGKNQHHVPHASAEQVIIASTIIQWLGSPVGNSFLVDVINNCPELKEYIKRCCFNQKDFYGKG